MFITQRSIAGAASFHSGSPDPTTAAVLREGIPRALFGVDPLVESFDEKGLSPAFDLKPIRKAVKILLDSLNQLPK